MIYTNIYCIITVVFNNLCMPDIINRMQKIFVSVTNKLRQFNNMSQITVPHKFLPDPNTCYGDLVILLKLGTWHRRTLVFGKTCFNN